MPGSRKEEETRQREGWGRWLFAGMSESPHRSFLETALLWFSLLGLALFCPSSPATLKTTPGRERHSNNTTVDPQDMAKARVQAQRQADQLAIHQDDLKEEEIEETLDESADPLEESGRTMDDSSEEEVEDSVAEDILRFEESFTGINKRYRLINRIGEGECRNWCGACRMQVHNFLG